MNPIAVEFALGGGAVRRLGATVAAAERPEASPEATCRPLPAAIPAPTTPAEDAIAGTAAATVIAFMALS